MRMDIRAQIEYVPSARYGQERLVFIRLVDTTPFRLTPTSTIESCPIAEMTLGPRAKSPDGTLRDDLITLIFARAEDLAGLSAGQEVLIRNVEPDRQL